MIEKTITITEVITMKNINRNISEDLPSPDKIENSQKFTNQKSLTSQFEKM